MNSPASILMVDDDELLTGAMAEFLKSKGLEVWTAHNGLEGYTRYLSHPTELVVTDIQMPELNGIEMIRCLRAITPALRTIYISGGAERFRDALKIEEQDFGVILLEKPFAGDDLLRLITMGTSASTVNSRVPHSADLRG
jgi:DNA-binding NtrC family response regulator